jgi:hypothetical protein
MAGGFTLKITRDFDHKAFDALKRLTGDSNRVVNVGVGPGTREPDGTPMAMIGAVHEYGEPSLGIQERAWLRPAITENREKYTALNRINLLKLMKGEITYDDALGQLGLMAQGMARQQIQNGTYQALKAATIRRKRSSKPLIDKGNFLQSITYAIGPRDD